MSEIPFVKLRPDAIVPRRAYEHDAALDLCAVEALTLSPGERAVVPTGIAVALPEGVCALTLPRSGLAARHGITIVNAPGLIDPGYRGEIRIVLLNTDREHPFEVRPGDRIAQLLVVDLPVATLVQVDELDATSRGARGFGSSGVAGGRDDDTATARDPAC